MLGKLPKLLFIAFAATAFAFTPPSTNTTASAYARGISQEARNFPGRVGNYAATFQEFAGMEERNYLPFKDSFLGDTGYVDGIGVDQLPEPAMWGVDPIGRLYTAFRYSCSRIEDGVNQMRECTSTIFQRYNISDNILAEASRDSLMPALDLNKDPSLMSHVPPMHYLDRFAAFLKREVIQIPHFFRQAMTTVQLGLSKISMMQLPNIASTTVLHTNPPMLAIGMQKSRVAAG